MIISTTAPSSSLIVYTDSTKPTEAAVTVIYIKIILRIVLMFTHHKSHCVIFLILAFESLANYHHYR